MDNKKRVALRVVFAARKAFLEYGAAVRLQAMWRGYFARSEIQLEIHAVATAAVTRLQALFRRYLAKRAQHFLLEATLTVQAHWRRWICVRDFRDMQTSMVLCARQLAAHKAHKLMNVRPLK